MDPEVYRLFARACPFILAWLLVFVALTVAALAWRWWTGRSERQRDSLIGGELPGILLVLMHSVCFVHALHLRDWVSALLFGWWGPGFLVVAILVLMERRVDWRRVAHATSIACKVIYLLLVWRFFAFGLLAPVFAYSLWIMHDQVRLAWLQQNADRTRRICEDRWLPRLCYPLFLAIPLFDADFPLRWLCAGAALVITILWVWGLVRLARLGVFLRKPASFTDNLRDIVYLQRPTEPGTGAAM